MNGTALGPVGRGRGSWRWWTGWLVALTLVGIVAVACSDNNGRATPTSAKLTGDGVGGIGGPSGSGILVQVTINPGTITRGRRAIVLVIVSSAHGIGLPGRRVQLAPTVGTLDATSGVTDANGLFSTTLFIPCEVGSGAGVTVAAVVEGVTSIANATLAPPSTATGLTNSPCEGVEPEAPPGTDGTA